MIMRGVRDYRGGMTKPGSPDQPGGQPDPYAPRPEDSGPSPTGQPGYPGRGYPPQGYPGPGYPPGGPGYPVYPGYAAGVAPQPEPARPDTVTWAFVAWMLVALASLVGLIVVLTDPAWDRALQAATRTAGVDTQSLVNVARTFAIIVFVIFVALFIFFAIKMYTGRNWARVVLTVLGALQLLNALTPTTTSVTVDGVVFRTALWPMYVTAVIVVAAIVLMYVAPSNVYFTASKAYRSQLRY